MSNELETLTTAIRNAKNDDQGVKAVFSLAKFKNLTKAEKPYQMSLKEAVDTLLWAIENEIDVKAGKAFGMVRYNLR